MTSAIEQFYTSPPQKKNFYTPQNKFLATPLSAASPSLDSDPHGTCGSESVTHPSGGHALTQAHTHAAARFHSSVMHSGIGERIARRRYALLSQAQLHTASQPAASAAQLTSAGCHRTPSAQYYICNAPPHASNRPTDTIR